MRDWPEWWQRSDDHVRPNVCFIFSSGPIAVNPTPPNLGPPAVVIQPAGLTVITSAQLGQAAGLTVLTSAQTGQASGLTVVTSKQP